MFRRIVPILLLCYFYSASQTDSLTSNQKVVDTASTHFTIPLFSDNGDDAGQQDVSGLLQSSNDVFVRFAGGQFGASGFKLRGYTSENQQVLINGVNVANLETGRSSWSNWGGLNDVTRFTENRFGITSNRYTFSGIGGYTNIDSRSSSFKRGTRFAYAFSNRIFQNRFMLTHSTGVLRSGWSLTLSASARFGNEIYITGTYFNAKSFYASIGKKINAKHELSVTSFFAPMEQGRSSSSQKEVYDLTDDHYYNSYWGYQNGKVRNASISENRRPTVMLSHIYQKTKNAKLTSTLSYNFGKASTSGLNFNNTNSPRPDYYGYLPSYYYVLGDTFSGKIQTMHWENDVNTRQINWDRLIAFNQANLYSDPHLAGQAINTSETRARYILEKRVNNTKNFSFNTVYTTRLKNTFLSFGFNAHLYKNRKYKEIADLLGASFWIDVDQFAQGIGVEESIQQNDINNPNKKVRIGDKFGYDYSINIRRAEFWAQIEHSYRYLDIYAGIFFADQAIWREGLVANGKFPTRSKGTSGKLNFINQGLKAGVTLKISGRQFLTVNGLFMTRAPQADRVFISPDTRNDLVSNVSNEEILSGDLSYIVKYPKLKLRLTCYSTQIKNQIWLRSYWHDSYATFVNLILKGLNQKQQGLEFGLEKTIHSSHLLQFVFGFSQNTYTNRPTLEAWQDNTSNQLFKNREVYLKNYRLGNSPQLVSGAGYRYNAKKFWFIGLNFNYCDQIYVELNPDRRTFEATEKHLDSEADLASIITYQEKLPGYYYLNLNGGKMWRIGKKNILNMNLSINNLLNNKNILVNGSEQLRWDLSNVNKFPNKYSYMTGRTYLISLSLSL